MPLKEAFTTLPSPFITSKRSYMSILESLIPLSCPTCAKSFEPCGVQSSFSMKIELYACTPSPQHSSSALILAH